MVWTPDSLTEREEGELLGALAAAAHEMGMDAYNEWADALILKNKAYLQKHAKPDSPALIRLNRLLLKQERGFE